MTHPLAFSDRGGVLAVKLLVLAVDQRFERQQQQRAGGASIPRTAARLKARSGGRTRESRSRRLGPAGEVVALAFELAEDLVDGSALAIVEG